MTDGSLFNLDDIPDAIGPQAQDMIRLKELILPMPPGWDGRFFASSITDAKPDVSFVITPRGGGGEIHGREFDVSGPSDIAEILSARDAVACTYTLDMGDGTDRVIAVYRLSDRFGYAWNLDDGTCSEYGYF